MAGRAAYQGAWRWTALALRQAQAHTGEATISRALTRVLERAAQEARHRGSLGVSGCDLLTGLVSQGISDAALLLQDAGVTPRSALRLSTPAMYA